jgi:hypothetical protein
VEQVANSSEEVSNEQVLTSSVSFAYSSHIRKHKLQASVTSNRACVFSVLAISRSLFFISFRRGKATSKSFLLDLFSWARNWSRQWKPRAGPVRFRWSQISVPSSANHPLQIGRHQILPHTLCSSLGFYRLGQSQSHTLQYLVLVQYYIRCLG